MLKFLNISNIAVIEHAEIEFSNGFNVLTGETGAGKSILIDSINAVLGERTSRSIIRTGCSRASVSAVFENVDDEIMSLLIEMGYEPEEDGSILIQRVISSDGKSSCRICGIPAAASTVKDIAARLISIHGQHDSQLLLTPQNHIKYLDAVAENEDVKQEYYRCYRKAVEIKKELTSLIQSESDKTSRLDYLNFLINELESANVKLGEMEELKKKQALWRNYEKLVGLISVGTALLDGDDMSPGAISLAETAAEKIGEAEKYDESLAGLSERLHNTVYDLGEVLSDVKRAAGNIDFDTADQQTLEERLDLLYRLTHKYSADEERLIEILEESKKEAASIIGAEEHISELEGQLSEVSSKLEAAAEKLTATRKAAGEELSRKIADELQFLNMPNVQFYVSVEPGRYTSNGADIVEFLISANSGEAPRQLSKVASGGELSRIMLAMKSAFSGKYGVGTIIYDEIDAGISGLAAEKVGTKLKQTSMGSQVICVTHLAQIAAAADNHLLIEKNVESGRTFTLVKPLDFNGRVREIARIMGGASMTESVLKSAEEMISAKSGLTKE